MLKKALGDRLPHGRGSKRLQTRVSKRIFEAQPGGFSVARPREYQGGLAMIQGWLRHAIATFFGHVNRREIVGTDDTGGR